MRRPAARVARAERAAAAAVRKPQREQARVEAAVAALRQQPARLEEQGLKRKLRFELAVEALLGVPVELLAVPS